MSLEQKIEALTAAVVALTQQLQGGAAAPAASAPVDVAPAPQPTPAPVVTAPAMPAPPSFAAAPTPAPAAPVLTGPAAPFNTPQGLMEYTMNSYKAMGPEKGAKIQQVLTSLGHANINDIKPEQYGQFYAGVEAIKAGA